MHVRGFWRAHDMTYLVERRFEKFLREFRLEARELRRRLVVAGGPGVSKALAKLDILHITAPSGRLGPLAQYVMKLAAGKDWKKN